MEGVCGVMRKRRMPRRKEEGFVVVWMVGFVDWLMGLLVVLIGLLMMLLSLSIVFIDS